ncbi:MAG: hypothetical protein A2252_01650 [Elusimicrobia bacterium RIFOXYA2_FULL_39_19]|nr:MAG: hypothetical protein A2252_01650 [Elusimicrobia bacterium RIFOXYA2_FULL_39_19]
MKKLGLRSIAVAVVVIIFCFNVSFAHPLLSDDASTVAPEKFDFEISYDQLKADQSPSISYSEITLIQGINKRTDIYILLPYTISPTPVTAIGTARLGMKFGLAKDLFAVTIDNELGSKVYFLNTVLSIRGKKASMHLNLGYNSFCTPGISDTTNYSVALELPKKNNSYMAEIIGLDGEPAKFWVLGLLHNFGSHFSGSLAYGKSFKDSSDRISAATHFYF